MSPLTQFSPPAYLTDFTPENVKRWSTEFVSLRMTREVKLPQVSQFYNEVTDGWTETPVRKNITWVAFPNSVAVSSGSDRERWRRADENLPPPTPPAGPPFWRPQDEYCEWSVQRNENGGIVRVVFTAEGVEYWDLLSQWQPETVLELYRKHNPGFDIKHEDLFPNGRYNPHNKWNNSTTTGCIMHLIQPNNTLRAQFHLGGQSTVLRIDSAGTPIRDPDRLLRCSRLGGPNRNSDPHIGILINNLAHDGPLVTIADPVGLYLDSFNGNRFRAPDGTNVNDFWTWTRGTPADVEKGREAQWVRAVFEVPPEKGYIVSDIEDRVGNKIQWGSQLADHIQVRLTGQIIRNGLHTADAHHCIGYQPSPTDKATETAEKEHECDRAEGLEDPGWSCY